MNTSKHRNLLNKGYRHLDWAEALYGRARWSKNPFKTVWLYLRASAHEIMAEHVFRRAARERHHV